MKIIKDKYTYEENFSNGRNCVLINEVECTRKDRNHFTYIDENNQEKEIIIEGTTLTGLVLIDGDKKIEIVCKIKWYEWILSLVFVFFIFMNYIYGAVLGGLVGICNLILVRRFKNPIIKIFITIGLLAITFGLVYLLDFLFPIKMSTY